MLIPLTVNHTSPSLTLAVLVFLGSRLPAKLNEQFSAFTSIHANEKESSHTPTHGHILKSLQTLHPSAFFVFQ